MAVLKRRGNVWHIDLVWDGRRIRESTKTGDRKLAEVRLGELQAALYRGTYVPSTAGGVGGSYTVAKAFDRAFEGEWLTEARAGTKIAALSSFRRLIADGYLKADDPVTILDRQFLAALQSKLVEAGLASATINHRFWTIRKLLAQAVEDGALKAMPRVPKNLKASKGRMRWLSTEEEDRLLAYLGSDDRYAYLRDLWVIMLDTGLRVASAASLRRRHIDWQNGNIVIPAAEIKNDDDLAVPLTDRVRAIIERRLGDGEAVFPVPEGAHPRYWVWKAEKDWRTLRRDLGFGDDVVLHSARHTFGTLLMATGTDLRSAMGYMGHKTPAMTLRYAKVVGANLKAAASRIEKFREEQRAQIQTQAAGNAR